MICLAISFLNMSVVCILLCVTFTISKLHENKALESKHSANVAVCVPSKTRRREHIASASLSWLSRWTRAWIHISYPGEIGLGWISQVFTDLKLFPWARVRTCGEANFVCLWFSLLEQPARGPEGITICWQLEARLKQNTLIMEYSKCCIS